MLSSAIARLFILAFATCTVTSSLLSAEITRHVKSLNGAVLNLLNFDASPEMLTETFTSLLRKITLKPVEAATYQEALKVILGQTYFDQRQELGAVNAAIQAIEDELLAELIANTDNVNDKLAAAVPKVVELMKAGFIDSIRARALGINQKLDYSDRVSNLKTSLRTRLIYAYRDKNIDQPRLMHALEKLNEGIPDNNPDVKELLQAQNENSFFLLRPGSNFDAVVKAQVGSVEASPDTLRNVPVAITAKIKETISLWLSTPENIDSGLSFARILASDVRQIETNPAEAFGQESTAEDVNGARAFLTDIMGHVLSTAIAIKSERITPKNRSQLIDAAFTIAENFFITRVFQHPAANLSALVENFYAKVLKGSFSIKEDTKLPELRKLQKYTGVIVVVNAGPALTEADKEDFVKDFSVFADLTTSEAAALNVMQHYLANSSAINFAKSEGIFGLMLTEFARFLSGADQSDLDGKTAYKRFDAYLAGKIAESAGKPKWFFVVLRLANFFLSGNQSADVPVDALGEDGRAVLGKQVSNGLFDGAYKQFLIVLITRDVRQSVALISQKNNSKDVDEQEKLKQEIQKVNDQQKLDSATLSQKTPPTPEQLADIRTRVLELITPGYTFVASRAFLI